MDEEQKRFTTNMARHIELFDSAIRHMGCPKIGGLDDLMNTVRFGRPLGKRKERFIENTIKSIESLEPYPEGKGIEGLAETTRKAFERIDICMQRIETDDPVEFCRFHKTTIDAEKVSRLFEDQSMHSKRFLETLKSMKPETLIPSLVEQYTATFENYYKPVNRLMQDILKDSIKDKKELNDIIERVMAIERTYQYKNGMKSDLRCIRNILSHSKGYDRGDHYHFEFDDGTSRDMSIEEFHRTFVLMNAKTMLVQTSLAVFIDFRMYHLLFEKAA